MGLPDIPLKDQPRQKHGFVLAKDLSYLMLSVIVDVIKFILLALYTEGWLGTVTLYACLYFILLRGNQMPHSPNIFNLFKSTKCSFTIYFTSP